MKKKRTLDKNVIGLLSNTALHQIIAIYMNTFLVAHILNISAGNFQGVALYYVVAYATMIVFYSLFSFIATKLNKTVLTRVSVILYAPILVMIAALGADIINYIPLIAFLYNIVNAMYYVSINSISNEVIHAKNMKTFNTYSSVVSSLTSIIIPVTFGRIIDTSSLNVISIFVVIVCLLEIATTFLIDKTKLSHNKFDLKGYYKKCYSGSNKKSFKLLFFGQLLNGCRDALSVLVTILIVLTFKTNTSLGAISSFISLASISILVITDKIKNPRFYKCFLPLTLITASSVLALIFNVNKVAIIIFNVCYSSLLAIILRSYSVRRSGLIRAVDKKEYILEHQAVSELFLNCGRMIFFSILLAVSFTSDIWIYKLLLAIGMVCILLFGTFGYLGEKEYERVLIEREFKKQLHKNDDLTPTYSNRQKELLLTHLPIKS